jgi:hypothetical protein
MRVVVYLDGATTRRRVPDAAAEVGREFGFELIDGQQFAQWRQNRH